MFMPHAIRDPNGPIYPEAPVGSPIEVCCEAEGIRRSINFICLGSYAIMYLEA